MRVPRVKHNTIKLDIDVKIENGEACIEYYNTDGNKTVFLCKEEIVDKKLALIKSNRQNLHIYTYKDDSYPLRDKKYEVKR